MSINTCVIRFNSNDEILLVKHRDRQWEFPGGKLDYSKDSYKSSCFLDLLKSSSREFKEEAGNNIGCFGSPSDVILKPESNTIFFVYTYQPCVFDCLDKFKQSILKSPDKKIESIKEFKIDNLPTLSFDTDKTLIHLIKNNRL